MRSPVIVFDFDKTLTKKDTLFGFYKFVSVNNLSFKFKRLILLFFSILYKLRIIKNNQLKN
jgi:hypothetical protein